MKYCVKCGNPMNDDMLFCQKCGTKSEMMVSSDAEIEEKMNSLNQYDICYKNISWESMVNENTFVDFLGKRDYISQDLNNLIDEILALTNENNRKNICDRLYEYIYKTSHELLSTAIRQLNDKSERDQYNEKLQRAFRAGQITSDAAINILTNTESNFIIIVTLNFLYSSTLIKHVDKKDKYYNDYCRRETVLVANQYNQLFAELNKRREGFLIPTPYKMAQQIIDNYFEIMCGLRKDDLKQISDDIWEKHAQVLESSGSREDARQFRDALKEGRLKVEKVSNEIEEEYWKNHPELGNQRKELEDEKIKLLQECAPFKGDIANADRKLSNYTSKVDILKREISDLEREISKLQGKIFGKKKAEEDIARFNIEIQNKNDEINRLNEQISQCNNEKSRAQSEIMLKEKAIREVEEKIKSMMNI